uniref:Uncharacterized protein n=1 Tax=Cacopsylla melanoneura TaxID=428564 RepID=A0A8D8XL98_9HEMI
MDPSPPPPPNHPYSHLWNPKHAADVRLLRDQQEREKIEQERERLEKLRGAEQAVDKHFEESLRPQRLAQHKQRSAGWNMTPTNTQHQQPQPRVVDDRMRDRYFPPPPPPPFWPCYKIALKLEPKLSRI